MRVHIRLGHAFGHGMAGVQVSHAGGVSLAHRQQKIPHHDIREAVRRPARPVGDPAAPQKRHGEVAQRGQQHARIGIQPRETRAITSLHADDVEALQAGGQRGQERHGIIPGVLAIPAGFPHRAVQVEILPGRSRVPAAGQTGMIQHRRGLHQPAAERLQHCLRGRFPAPRREAKGQASGGRLAGRLIAVLPVVRQRLHTPTRACGQPPDGPRELPR